jgi:hypothetical protein
MDIINMDIKLIDKFKNLHDEIIHIIINYTGIITYRNGKFMNRLKKDDSRFILLKKIPIPIFIGKKEILLQLINNRMSGYFIKYIIENSYIKLNVCFFHIEKDGFDKYFDIKSNDTYLFDIHNKWTKLVNYL